MNLKYYCFTVKIWNGEKGDEEETDFKVIAESEEEAKSFIQDEINDFIKDEKEIFGEDSYIGTTMRYKEIKKGKWNNII